MIAEPMIVDVSQDWETACGLQERFMENACAEIPGFTWNGRCRQMRALGGDCFQVAPMPGGCVAFSIADASGKGLPAALIVANVQSSLRTAVLFAPEDPGAVVTAVNRQLYACSPADRYVTLFHGVFDEETRTLQYVSAGHNPVLVVRWDREIVWLDASGPPAGLFAGTIYEAQTVRLDSGDLIMAYTDGVVEAMNAAGEEWGVSGLLATINGCGTRQPESVVEAVYAALDRFSGARQTDDATVLAALVQ